VVAYASRLERDTGLVGLFRFAIVPMFLFSGTFFPITQLPGWLQPLAYATPLWHGVELTRAVALGIAPAWNPAIHLAYLAALVTVGIAIATRNLRTRLLP
jgi:lipooligosaccharide transport system permease protein